MLPRAGSCCAPCLPATLVQPYFLSCSQAPPPRAAVGVKSGAKSSEFAYGLPGASNVLGEFDPAGFLKGKSKLEVYRLREAETAHGRVAMLASLGFMIQVSLRLVVALGIGRDQNGRAKVDFR